MTEQRAAAPRWERSAEVAVVDHGASVVLLALAEPTTARPLVLEGPASAVWRALAEAGTTEQVTARVAADFGLPAAEVRRDVEEFLRRLLAVGLVVMAADGRSGGDRDGERSDA